MLSTTAASFESASNPEPLTVQTDAGTDQEFSLWGPDLHELSSGVHVKRKNPVRFFSYRGVGEWGPDSRWWRNCPDPSWTSKPAYAAGPMSCARRGCNNSTETRIREHGSLTCKRRLRATEVKQRRLRSVTLPGVHAWIKNAAWVPACCIRGSEVSFIV